MFSVTCAYIFVHNFNLIEAYFTWFYFQKQYVALHKALVEALDTKDTAILKSEFSMEWNKLKADARPTNERRLRKEFEVRNTYYSK